MTEENTDVIHKRVCEYLKKREDRDNHIYVCEVCGEQDKFMNIEKCSICRKMICKNDKKKCGHICCGIFVCDKCFTLENDEYKCPYCISDYSKRKYSNMDTLLYILKKSGYSNIRDIQNDMRRERYEDDGNIYHNFYYLF